MSWGRATLLAAIDVIETKGTSDKKEDFADVSSAFDTCLQYASSYSTHNKDHTDFYLASNERILTATRMFKAGTTACFHRPNPDFAQTTMYYGMWLKEVLGARIFHASYSEKSYDAESSETLKFVATAQLCLALIQEDAGTIRWAIAPAADYISYKFPFVAKILSDFAMKGHYEIALKIHAQAMRYNENDKHAHPALIKTLQLCLFLKKIEKPTDVTKKSNAEFDQYNEYPLPAFPTLKKFNDTLFAIIKLAQPLAAAPFFQATNRTVLQPAHRTLAIQTDKTQESKQTSDVNPSNNFPNHVKISIIYNALIAHDKDYLAMPKEFVMKVIDAMWESPEQRRNYEAPIAHALQTFNDYHGARLATQDGVKVVTDILNQTNLRPKSKALNHAMRWLATRGGGINSPEDKHIAEDFTQQLKSAITAQGAGAANEVENRVSAFLTKLQSSSLNTQGTLFTKSNVQNAINIFVKQLESSISAIVTQASENFRKLCNVGLLLGKTQQLLRMHLSTIITAEEYPSEKITSDETIKEFADALTELFAKKLELHMPKHREGVDIVAAPVYCKGQHYNLNITLQELCDALEPALKKNRVITRPG